MEGGGLHFDGRKLPFLLDPIPDSPTLNGLERVSFDGCKLAFLLDPSSPTLGLGINVLERVTFDDCKLVVVLLDPPCSPTHQSAVMSESG